MVDGASITTRHQTRPRPASTKNSMVLQAMMAVLAVVLILASPTKANDYVLPLGEAEISGTYLDSDIVIQTTSRLAGAIDSLTWRGQEFVDSADHGRQIQSASNFCDGNTPFYPETFNPTEAGSRCDGAGPNSTSQLLHLRAVNNTLQTTSQMAFWLRPIELSAGHPAANTQELSDHLLTKRVTIGFEDMPNVIQYDVTFSIPVGEFHTYAQFEAVTGYMPPEFSEFYYVDTDSVELVDLSDGPGEQDKPVVLATEDGEYAMGIYSPDQPSKGYEVAGYGRFRFVHEGVVKWNSVFRYKDEEYGIPAGDYSFRNFVVIGTQEEVAATITDLHHRFLVPDDNE